MPKRRIVGVDTPVVPAVVVQHGWIASDPFRQQNPRRIATGLGDDAAPIAIAPVRIGMRAVFFAQREEIHSTTSALDGRAPSRTPR